MKQGTWLNKAKIFAERSKCSVNIALEFILKKEFDCLILNIRK